MEALLKHYRDVVKRTSTWPEAFVKEFLDSSFTGRTLLATSLINGVKAKQKQEEMAKAEREEMAKAEREEMAKAERERKICEAEAERAEAVLRAEKAAEEAAAQAAEEAAAQAAEEAAAQAAEEAANTPFRQHFNQRLVRMQKEMNELSWVQNELPIELVTKDKWLMSLGEQITHELVTKKILLRKDLARSRKSAQLESQYMSVCSNAPAQVTLAGRPRSNEYMGTYGLTFEVVHDGPLYVKSSGVEAYLFRNNNPKPDRIGKWMVTSSRESDPRALAQDLQVPSYVVLQPSPVVEHFTGSHCSSCCSCRHPSSCSGSTSCFCWYHQPHQQHQQHSLPAPAGGPIANPAIRPSSWLDWCCYCLLRCTHSIPSGSLCLLHLSLHFHLLPTAALLVDIAPQQPPPLLHCSASSASSSGLPDLALPPPLPPSASCTPSLYRQ